MENRALDWINVVGTPVRPTSPLKVALYTVAPNQETGVGGTEVVGGAYARTNVVFTAAATGSSTNTADVTFPTATAAWGTVVAAAVFDSAATPVMIWSGPLPTAKVVDTSDTLRIPLGQLSTALD